MNSHRPLDAGVESVLLCRCRSPDQLQIKMHLCGWLDSDNLQKNHKEINR